MSLEDITIALGRCYMMFYANKMTEILSLPDGFKRRYMLSAMKQMMKDYGEHFDFLGIGMAKMSEMTKGKMGGMPEMPTSPRLPTRPRRPGRPARGAAASVKTAESTRAPTACGRGSLGLSVCTPSARGPGAGGLGATPRSSPRVGARPCPCATT